MISTTSGEMGSRAFFDNGSKRVVFGTCNGLNQKTLSTFFQI